MADMIPGTVLKYPAGKTKDAFSVIAPVLSATGGLTLRQVCDMTGLKASTVQNWVKRGWVANPKGKRYEERQLMRILLINLMREAMQLERIISLMTYINGSVEDTVDDIIPDRQLYSFLCEILYKIEQVSIFDDAGVKDIVEKVISDYKCSSEDEADKLKRTLIIMTWASIAVEYRHKSSQEFLLIK